MQFSDVAGCRDQEDCKRVWGAILDEMHRCTNDELLVMYEEGKVFWNPYCLVYDRKVCPLNKRCGPLMRACVDEWYTFNEALIKFIRTGEHRYELDLAITKLKGLL